MYSLGYGEARCMKCADNHILDSSRTQCLAESETGVTVTNCDV